MNRLFSTKSVAAAAIVLGAFGAATAAHARSDVVFSIGVQAPGVYVQPAPVYSQAPVYVQSRPVYVEPRPVYVEPRPVYVQPQYGDRWDNRWDRWDHRHDRHQARLYGPYGDLDHDGVANRYDRYPQNPNRN